MKRLWILVVALPFLAVAALSQATNDAPATREDITKLFQTMKVRDQTQKSLEAVMAQQRAMVRETMRKRHPELTEDNFKHLDEMLGTFWKDFPIDQMLDDMIPVYQKHLTKGDVDAMAAFYASPTGKKLLNDMPAIMAESMQAMGPHLQESMEKMMDQLEQKAREEKASKPATVKN